MYNKVMIIDDRIVVTGSYNFSENAESNDKNMLILESSMAAAAYTKYFELLFEQYQKHDEQVVALSILCRAVARSPEVQPLTGDRSIREKDFGRIQIDRVLEMEKWAESIKTVQDEHIKLAIIAANNHYAGFGPGTANVFRNMLGLPEAKWEDRGKEQEQEESAQDDLDVKQSTLSDSAHLGQHSWSRSWRRKLVIEASPSIPSSPQQLKVRVSMAMASAQTSEIS